MSALLIDFGGTLDDDGVYWAQRYFAGYLEQGGSLDFAAFETIFRATDSRMSSDPAVCSLGMRAMIDHQARLLAQSLKDVNAEALADEFHARLSSVVARNRPVLARLSQAHPIAVVSNFTGNLERCLRELELASLVNVVIDSRVEGVAKPDPQIFERALSRLGARASDSWFVGDNVEADLRPAAALGMTTCWVAPPDRSAPPDFAPAHRIARFVDLEELLP